MEMCCDGALVMPRSYAVMSEEEMTYVEGGNGWYNSRGFIAAAIDIGIAVVTAGQAIAGIYAIKAFLKSNSRKIVKNVSKTLLKYFGSVSASVVSCAIDVALIAAGTSIGGLIAYGLDYADGKLNGYVFG